MRITFILATLVLVLAACKKDKYTTAPQIKFKSINPDFAASDLTTINREYAPKLTIEITDSEGDLGLVKNKDTSWVHVKNLLSNNIDSFSFPDLQTAAGKNFKADIVVNLFDALECINPGPVRPRTDTLYYEVYVNDFAKNKSNVIVTDKPVYFRCL